jgi:uncharacterized Fe-S cluster-containing MiaB family protein
MKENKLNPCPDCGESDGLSISSCASMRLSQVTCSWCGYFFQNGAVEENIHKYWNKIYRGYEYDETNRSWAE